jgi:hypothetical protein
MRMGRGRGWREERSWIGLSVMNKVSWKEVEGEEIVEVQVRYNAGAKSMDGIDQLRSSRDRPKAARSSQELTESTFPQLQPSPNPGPFPHRRALSSIYPYSSHRPSLQDFQSKNAACLID